MKGYKAYEKGLVCRGKQYKIGEIFEEERAEICDSGIHYCENPLDCLDHYPLIDNEGNFVEMTEVEDLDSENRETENNRKFCTKKLKINAKVSFGEMIKAGLEFILEKSIEPASSGDDSQLASSGNYSKLASSGDDSQLASSGNYSKLASSGNYSKLASSGNYSKLASSGDDSQLASSGYGSKLASSGNGSKLASSGNGSKLASSGNGSKLASSGYGSKLASSGYNSVVANIGNRGLAKAKKGSWIVLAEYTGEGIPICVKSELVDGIVIKEDTWYRLQDGIFKEVE